MPEAPLLFHVPLADSLEPAQAVGHVCCRVDERGDAPTLENDDVRPGARFGRKTCLHYPAADNFPRNAGTVALWFKPDWPANFEDRLGRILWDLRIEHGSIVPDDPSQRYALVYPTVAGRGGQRAEATFGCWRFCIATNRNRYTIGAEEKRPDKRTRQAVFGRPQAFAAKQWMHLAVTWTPHKGSILVNGALDAEAALPEGLPSKPFPPSFTIGAIESWINAGPCGVIADFRIYGGALDEGAIAGLAQN